MAIPVVVPIPLSLYFDVFDDGMIQAIVFVFLQHFSCRNRLSKHCFI